MECMGQRERRTEVGRNMWKEEHNIQTKDKENTSINKLDYQQINKRTNKI